MGARLCALTGLLIILNLKELYVPVFDYNRLSGVFFGSLFLIFKIRLTVLLKKGFFIFEKGVGFAMRFH